MTCTDRHQPSGGKGQRSAGFITDRIHSSSGRTAAAGGHFSTHVRIILSHARNDSIFYSVPCVNGSQITLEQSDVVWREITSACGLITDESEGS